MAHSKIIIETMKYISAVSIIFILNPVLGLRGSPDSVCYEIARHERHIGNKERGEWVPIAVCCKGYKANNDICEAQCKQPCVYGQCVKPNECICDKGYTGVSCEKRICPAGYKGLKCDEECSEGTFGRNCEEKCECQNGRCDTVNGSCYCDAGWTGDTCSNKCSNGTYGLNCSKKCNCQNDGICDSINGNCECLPGEKCEEKCKEGYWGKNCTQNCDCPKNKCNPIDGTCDIICENGEYINDICVCNSGWVGQFCTDMLCRMEFYGQNCEKRCPCIEGRSQMCHRETGECLCKPGWHGQMCEEICSGKTFGQNCSYTLECVFDNFDTYDPISGECDCYPEWTGKFCEIERKCMNGTYNNLGNCVCNSGWQGENCDKECDDGKYGPGCLELCFLNGVGNNRCDPVTGPICIAGFSTETNCILPCEEGTYGESCQNCSCANAINCDRVTGDCECLPGWSGDKCGKKCPDGYYGTDCKQDCTCEHCRHTDGYCKCQEGWNGTHCQDYCPEYYFDATVKQCIEADSIIISAGTSSIIVVGMILSLLIFFMIFVCIKAAEDKPGIEIPYTVGEEEHNTLIRIHVKDDI